MPQIRGIQVPKESDVKNYIINGDMRLAQRGTSFPAIVTSQYSLDQWVYAKSGAMVHTVSQDTDVPTFAQAGYLFQNSLRLNLTTPDDSIAAGDHCVIQQYIEGFNFANIAQKPFTLSFWVKATLAGTRCINIRNLGDDRSIIKEYTINAPNTWEKKTLTFVASPSAGSWNYTNGVGLKVSWTLVSGTTFQTSPDSWQTGVFLSTSNQVNSVATGNTDFRITGVMLNEGVAATPFKLFGEDVEGELAACQRYYEASGQTFRFQNIDTVGRNSFCHSIFSVRKRASPSVTLNNTGQTNVGAFSFNGSNSHHILWQWSGNGSAIDFQNTANWTADAEL